MKFRLELDCDKAAFGEPITGKPSEIDRHQEVRRCLQRVANFMREEGPILDTNGNTVGRFWFEKTASKD
jgi:hypothetical protein